MRNSLAGLSVGIAAALTSAMLIAPAVPSADSGGGPATRGVAAVAVFGNPSNRAGAR